jgi:hypothetical protein
MIHPPVSPLWIKVIMNTKALTLLSINSIGISVIATLSNAFIASAVTITYEAPNVTSASPSVGSTVKNNFESAALGTTNNYNFNFVDAASGDNYRATYDKLQVANYGSGSQTAGAGYTGQFAVNNSTVPTTNITFSDTTTANSNAGVKYFGLFFSSLDAGNQLTFYNGSTVLAQLSISNFCTLVNNCSAFNGGPYNQPGAFFNFYAGAGEQFTKIALTQTTSGGGFENDNHTFLVPAASAISGTGVNLAGLSVTAGNVNSTAVPEPFTIVGTLIGGTAAFRMRKKLKAIAD